MEDTKGTPLQLEAYRLLQEADAQGLLHFAGNVEARDVPLGVVDVVVADGFSGNILLKSIEGTAMYMTRMMKGMFTRNLWSKLGYLLCKPGVRAMRGQLDYNEAGGTMLLGIAKPVIKAHGSSKALGHPERHCPGQAGRGAGRGGEDQREYRGDAAAEGAIKQGAIEHG